MRLNKLKKSIFGVTLSITVMSAAQASPVNAADFSLQDFDSFTEAIEDIAEDNGIDIDLPSTSDVEKILDDVDSAVHDVVTDYITDEEYEDIKKQMRKSLDDLIKKYSGSLKLPEGSVLPAEDFEDLYELIQNIINKIKEGNTGEDDLSVYHNGELMQVSSEKEFMDLLYEAQKEMVDYLYFETVDGYMIDDGVSDDDAFWDHIYVETINRDPVVGAGSGFINEQFTQMGNEYIWRYLYDDKEEIARMRSESQKKIDEVARTLNKTCSDDFSKVKAVNDFLCDSTYYPLSEPYPMPTHMVYGAAIDNCAVCEGYAGAAKAILDQMGVDCMVEIGECTGGGNHVWNIVKVDGKWYQLDVTWNDENEAGDRYLFFLVTDDYMRESRSWDYECFPSTPLDPYFF